MYTVTFDEPCHLASFVNEERFVKFASLKIDIFGRQIFFVNVM